MPRGVAGQPAALRALASGVLVDQGMTVLTASAALEGHERVWVRDGLGRLGSALVTRRDMPSGLAELRLDIPLKVTGPALALAARDPFSGSPAFTVAYPKPAEPEPNRTYDSSLMYRAEKSDVYRID